MDIIDKLNLAASQNRMYTTAPGEWSAIMEQAANEITALRAWAYKLERGILGDLDVLEMSRLRTDIRIKDAK